jgi:hypothetical protein
MEVTSIKGRAYIKGCGFLVVSLFRWAGRSNGGDTMSASGHGRYRCSQGRQRGANLEPWKPGPARDVVFGKLEAEKNGE